VVFIHALPADENLGVCENLQFPAGALPRMIPEFAAVNVTVRQSDAPDFLARLQLARRHLRPVVEQRALMLRTLVLTVVSWSTWLGSPPNPYLQSNTESA